MNKISLDGLIGLCAFLVLCTTKIQGASNGKPESYNPKPSFGSMTVSDSGDRPGYAIITTSEIVKTSTMLGDFIVHKESVGFDVQVITEVEFGGGIGDIAAENIRAWLQDHYISDNIEYVLLIGDPRTDISEVPMKQLWPRHNDPNYLKTSASDFYYADLTGNWDLDGDGNYGEWGSWGDPNADFGPGGVDRCCEVLVGRIPCYKSQDYQFPYNESVECLDAILLKTIDYEEQTLIGQSIEWRRSALLPMEMAVWVGEEIKDEILVPRQWSYHRIYGEDHGLDQPPETVPCIPDTLTSVWSLGTFGLVVWVGHIQPYVQRLNDTYPSFTFQGSCGSARPDRTNNVAYEILKNGGICSVGATCPVYTCRDAGGCVAHMSYEYTARLVAGFTSGQALYDLKQVVPPDTTGSWQNYTAFNIYGDPALRIVPPTRSIHFVNVTAIGNNDGSSWADACNSLQDALAAACWGDEIRIAEGIYKPDAGTGFIEGDRTATFSLKTGVAVYGGFPSDGGDWSERDPAVHETILSGDLNYDDGPEFENNTDNSYHVVTAHRFVYAVATLDGVIISGGNSNGDDPDNCGGGIYIDKWCYPTIANCVIRENAAAKNGGGTYCWRCSPSFVNCTIMDNLAGKYGGGLDIDIGSIPTLCNCTLNGNSADFGGGIANVHNSSPTLTNCTLYGNQANRRGGGMYNRTTCSPNITNCIFWGNVDRTGASESAQINGGKPHVTYCCIQRWTGVFDGKGNIDVDPLFSDSINGDYHLMSQTGRWDPVSSSWVKDDVTSPCIDAGDPNSDWTAEPWPNGERINIGVYGGTSEASMSSAPK